MADLKAETLCHKMGDVKAKALIYQLVDTVTECNPLVHVETDADTLQRDIIANSKTIWPATESCKGLSTNRHLLKHFVRQ